MKTQIESKHKSWITILSKYQLLGGVFGIVLTILNLGRFIEAENGIIFFLIYIILLAISVYGGVLLYMGDYEDGLLFSLISQILQVVYINNFGVLYKFVSGIGVLFYYDLIERKLNTSIDFFTAFFYLGEGSKQEIGVNFIALILVIFILFLKKQIFKNV